MDKLVMVIDNSLTVRKIIETSLRREEIECIGFPNGIEALQALADPRHPTPDLVFLNIMLPEMDGYEFARHLKAKSQFNNTIIIMLSSRDSVIDRLKSRLAGAKDCITKPFRTQDIIAAIHSYLNVPVHN